MSTQEDPNAQPADPNEVPEPYRTEQDTDEANAKKSRKDKGVEGDDQAKR